MYLSRWLTLYEIHASVISVNVNCNENVEKCVTI
jgi:hypothetical protein